MTRRFFIFAALLASSFSVLAQKTGSWRDHFAYNQGVDVMLVQDLPICATTAGLVFIDEGEVKKISKASGLSDFGISAALYDAQSKRIFLGYDNGNLDILNSTDPDKIRQGNQTKNITAWKNSTKFGRKSITRFLRVDSKMYVATSARILEIGNDEIQSDFSIDENGADTLAVHDLALFGDIIVAATPKGLYTINKASTQIYFYGSWQKLGDLSGQNVISLAVKEATLYALCGDGALYATTDLQTFSLLATYPNPNALSIADGDLWLSTSAMLYNITSPAKNISSYGNLDFNPTRINTYKSDIYIADLLSGFVVNTAGTFEQAIPNGPLQNASVALAEQGGKLASLADGALSYLENKGEWSGVKHTALSNPYAVKINAQNVAETFVATASGVAKFSGLNFVNKNLSGDIGGMSFDRNGNLFAFASNSSTPVKLRNADDSWTSLANPTLQSKTLGRLACAGRTFWGISGSNQLYLYAPGTSLTDNSDDNSSIISVLLSGGESFSGMNTIYSLAVDLNNAIWLGTNKGVVTYSAVNDPFTNTPTGQRPKLPTEIVGIASYLLEYEKVTAIVVDGGNRKWFGTRDAGAFLQSEDGVEQLQTFNTQNSPLPSNHIVDIAINSQTGEVIFATDKGMVGFYGDATAGKSEFGEARVFPNPVRPNMAQVTISNLMEDASVRITDVSGNLVFAGAANGGTLTWDVKNLNGNRVATGVYLIFLADITGQETTVIKLLVVN